MNHGEGAAPTVGGAPRADFGLYKSSNSRLLRASSPHSSSGGGMIAQIFGFTRHLLKEWNIITTEVVSCKFKDQVRARQSGEKWGLVMLRNRCWLRMETAVHRVGS